jgi:hypothetical protein
MLVPVDDHVQTIVDCAQSLRLQLLILCASLTFHLNVLSCRNLPFLYNDLTLHIEPGLVSIGEGTVATLTLDAGFDKASPVLVGLRMFEERLNNL